MSRESARAHYLNKDGKGKLNCAQAVVAAFSEKFPIEPGSVEAYSGYGSGKAPDGECGAYHAAKLVVQKYGAGKSEEFAAAFSGKAGSTKCREIRRLRRIPCLGCVETAAEFIDGLAASAAGAAKSAKMAAAVTRVSPEEAYRAVADSGSVKLLDVRSPLEFKGLHIKGSINIPLDILKDSLADLKRSGQECVVVCRTGARAAIAADMLAGSGTVSAKVLDGGISGWQKCRLPVVRGESGISLERQMRIISGSMVVTGIALSWTVDRSFGLISMFAGCGLIYAGLTDNCPMGMLLMKLPYNKRMYRAESCDSACSSK
jgi:rhodanese-related sulfurtransferase